MKRISLLESVRMLLKTAFRYASQHHNTLPELDKQYSRQWTDPNLPGQQLSTTIRFTPYGSLYKVIETTYSNAKVVKEETRVATYGWHSNGHLIEIGGYRFWIFDPLGGALYVEYYNEQEEKGYDVYTRNNAIS